MKRKKQSDKKMSNQKRSKALSAIVCVLVVACLLAGGVYINTENGMLQKLLSGNAPKTPAETESNAVMESMAVDVDSKAAIAVFQKEFLLATKDGVKYFASMGDQKWNDTFNMTAPVLVQEGDYVAVGDVGGKTVRVYNREGLLYDLQAEGSPMQFALNERGYLSLITKSGKSYHICIYDAKGRLLKERMEETKGVYPLCSDVSDDSETFAVTYLDTTDISPISRIVLFYIDAEEDESHTDSMFAAVEKSDELIPTISFMEKGVLAAISDLNVYGINSDGEELWKFPLENTVEQAAFGEKAYIVLALGDSVAGKDGRKKGTICWLNADGKEKAAFESGEGITYLRSAKAGVVIGSGRKYIGLHHSGAVNWEYTATGDLAELIPMEKLNLVMTVRKNQVSVFDMSKA